MSCNCKCHEEEDDYNEENHDPEPCDDCGKWDCMCREIEHCSCGAWAWSSSSKQMVRRSDCIC
jgi:hypothetical protein